MFVSFFPSNLRWNVIWLRMCIQVTSTCNDLTSFKIHTSGNCTEKLNMRQNCCWFFRFVLYIQWPVRNVLLSHLFRYSNKILWIECFRSYVFVMREIYHTATYLNSEILSIVYILVSFRFVMYMRLAPKAFTSIFF